VYPELKKIENPHLIGIGYRFLLRADFSSQLSLALALNQKGDPNWAASYREALRLKPNDADVHYWFGRLLGEAGDHDGAIAEYRQALHLNPSHELSHFDLAAELDQKGDLDGSIAEYRQAVSLNPSDAAAHFRLGRALRDKGDSENALEELHKAALLQPKNAVYSTAYKKLSEEPRK
jgi:tetratricopeptide (TPR) repeat protein